MEEMELPLPPVEKKRKLYWGGDTSKQIGWVEVFNGVNVMQYTVDKSTLNNMNNVIILSLGDSLKEEYFGAFDRSRHKLPY